MDHLVWIVMELGTFFCRFAPYPYLLPLLSSFIWLAAYSFVVFVRLKFWLFSAFLLQFPAVYLELGATCHSVRLYSMVRGGLSTFMRLVFYPFSSSYWSLGYSLLKSYASQSDCSLPLVVQGTVSTCLGLMVAEWRSLLPFDLVVWSICVPWSCPYSGDHMTQGHLELGSTSGSYVASTILLFSCSSLYPL